MRWACTDDAALGTLVASLLMLGGILGKNSASVGQGAAVLAGTLLLAAGCILFRQEKRWEAEHDETST